MDFDYRVIETGGSLSQFVSKCSGTCLIRHSFGQENVSVYQIVGLEGLKCICVEILSDPEIPDYTGSTVRTTLRLLTH